MDHAEDLGTLIDHYLNTLERSASWLARQIGRDAATISRWRSGESRPQRFVDVLRMAHAFGIRDEREKLRFLDVAARFFD